MHVLAEAASREAELQPQPQKHQVLKRAAAAKQQQHQQQQQQQQGGKQPGPPMPRIHTLNKAQVAGVNQLTSKQAFAGQKILSQQNLLNHKMQHQTANQKGHHHQQNSAGAAAIAANQNQMQTFKQMHQKQQQTIANANVLKSSSLPNLANMSKIPVNSNVILTTKQVANSTMQSSQMQQQNNSTTTQQRGQALASGRSQQSSSAKSHMLLKIGQSNKSNSNSQSGSTKSSKIGNAHKTANQQTHVIQQQRNLPNSQGLTVVQHQQQLQQTIQQQQLVMGSQPPQKQPGCIKTLTPHKSGQKNHAQKNIKTSVHANSKANPQANAAGSNALLQKGSIKTLLPQPTGGATTVGTSVVTSTACLLHKVAGQPIKMQQQAMQQPKQLAINATTAVQYTQTIRPQPSQIKTILPASEARRENELKIEIKTDMKLNDEGLPHYPQSPQRRVPLPYECLQFVLQDHNYGAPPPRTPPPPSPPPHPKQQPVNGATNTSVTTTPHPFIFNQTTVNNTPVEDDAASAISSEAGREVEPEGEETETAPEGEGDDEDSVTRCICDFEHDDGYMICCDRCLVWQHVDCMGIDRSNIPDEYLCEVCRPRRVDRARARALQMRKREELLNSDTTSDSSSTSSADTDATTNANPKNRKTPQQQQPQQQSQQQQQSIPRRKADAPQVRRLANSSNNNNNNIAKRQRRDTNPRQTNTVRNKKEVPTTTTPQPAKQQRGPGKRKTKRRSSIDDKEDDNQESWGSNMAPLRQWIERYEEAVTNHYSPELRARISSIKVNGTHNDLKQNIIGTVAAGKYRLNIQSNNLRFLVATMHLPPNTPIVELRGKYMLSTQHRPSHPQGRQHSQRPGPFVFFYRLPREGTEVCVDTRTYGNDARFVRRSCKPNAEVKHCIEKGTLHLYIVTSAAIEKNAEITIRHDQHDLMLSPNSNSSNTPLMCACNNAKDCQIANLTPAVTNRRGTNGPLAENTDGRERRRRGRRNTVCEESNDSPIKTTTTVTTTTTITTTTTTTATATATNASTPPPPATPTPAPAPVPQASKKTVTINTNVTVKDIPNTSTSTNANSNSNSNNSTPIVTRQTVKEEEQQAQQPAVLPPAQPTPVPSQTITKTTPSSVVTSQNTAPEVKKDKKKMTREERKMEAIMKAFERLEKAEQRKQEVQARNAQRKESEGAHSDNDDSGGHGPPKSKHNVDRGPKRKRRKGRTRSSSTSQSSTARRTRMNSAESDLTSGDESTTMRSLSNQNCSYSLRLHAAKSSSPTKTSQSGISTAAGLLLALANSNTAGSSSPPQQQPNSMKSPSGDSGTSSSSQSSTPSTPLSSACLLVAAAVGPLAPGFKFPKTKKVLMNEWLKESPEPPSNPSDTRGPDLTCGSEQSSEFLSQNYAAKGLATLVQAAHSVSSICDSSTQRNKANSAVTASVPVSTVSSGSAKKRWLRQAISEECDSPNSSRPESPPSEMLAPPKKRRIARESLSSDNYTPPTTPTMQQDHVPTHRRSMNEDDFVEHMPSPSTEDIGSQNEYDSDQIKDEIKTKLPKSDEIEQKHQISSSVHVLSTNIKEESQPILITKIKEELKSEDEQVSFDNIKHCLKKETENIKNETKSESPKMQSSVRIKTEPFTTLNETAKIEKKPIKIEDVVEKGTVEIVDQNEQDLEADDLSSPIAAMESDADLKQRVAELRLEFGGGIVEIGNHNNQITKSFEDQPDSTHAKHDEDRYDDNNSIDEFDVEAQMKKITGDDGDDYKEKIDSNSERDKSMDGIEGLMESSKEDSESEPESRHIEDVKVVLEKPVENATEEKRMFKEFECKHKALTIEEEFEAIKQQMESRIIENKIEHSNMTNKESLDSIEKELESSKTINSTDEVNQCSDNEFIQLEGKSTSFITPEESMMELDSMELPSEEIPEEPATVFASIPPLSERIRKKADSNPASKSKLEIEASIIESSLDLELVEDTQNGEEKKILSTALRELLEAKIETDEEPKPEIINTKVIDSKRIEIPETPVPSIISSPIINEQINKEVVPVAKKEESTPPETKRLKDPRTVVPNKVTTTSPSKAEGPPPAKRKLSISEYRKRMQQSTGTPPEPENSETSTEGKSASRGRSDSASSGTSSLSSDDESAIKAPLDIPSLSTLPLFANAEGEEKKGNDEGTIGWSAAPTLVERQRENLTERLKREFGLFLNDDEEERTRKQGLSSDALLKSTNVTAGNSSNVSYPVAQLPPQPYIPPPGSASIHYSQYPTKPAGSAVVQYPSYPVPPPVGAPNYPPPPIAQTPLNPQQFVVPQAPPGSNPYPPTQFAITAPPPPPPPPPPVPPPAPVPVPPPTTTTVSISRFSPATAQPVQPVVAYPLPPPQKTFYNHPTPRS